MRVYYVRHGQTEANATGIVAGSKNDTKLTAEGKRQAKRAGKDLKDKSIDLIVCSPMLRTVHTAEIIAQELGYDSSKIIKNVLLTERAMGIFEEGSYEEYRKASRLHDNYEGLESKKAMVDRARKALSWLKKQGGTSIVLVSHGGTGRAIKGVIENIHHEDLYTLDAFGNTEIYEFEL